MLSNPLRRFRLVGYLEAISFLLLLGIAMPLKYLAGLPLAVTIVGSLHGLLFVLYIFSVINVKFAHNWGMGRSFGALVASVLPFGPFVFDAWLKKQA